MAKVTRRIQRSRFQSLRQNGSAIAEFGPALFIILSVCMAAGFAAFEASQVFMIKSTLDFAAQTAARRLSLAYAQDPVTAMAFPEKVFDQIRFNKMVVSSDQFDIPDGTAGWKTTTTPQTVTVEVTFQGGKYGLDKFPNHDPLGLSANFQIKSVGIARLE